MCRAVLGPWWADAGYCEDLQASVFSFIKWGAGAAFSGSLRMWGDCVCVYRELSEMVASLL